MRSRYRMKMEDLGLQAGEGSDSKVSGLWKHKKKQMSYSD